MRPRSLCSSALLLTAGLSILFSPPVIRAQQDDDADTKAVARYQLTMPKYKKYLAAMVNLAKAAERGPAVGKAMEGYMEQSINQSVAKFNRSPEVRRAISSAGLTTRDFILAQAGFLTSGLAYGLMKELKITPDSAVKLGEVSRANLEFYRRNEAEMTRLYKEAEAKTPALKQDADVEEKTGEEDDGAEN